MTDKSVSVIIPVKDDAAGLGRLLPALARQDYLGPVEVVVVDNGSRTEEVRDVTVRHGARYVQEQVPGSYAARNAGVRYSTGEVLAFTDADCVPWSTWLSTALAALGSDQPPTVVVGRVRVTVRDAARPSPAEAWELVHGFRQDVYVRRSGWGATANLVVPRSVMDQVGPFDQRLRSGGDAEWGRRASAGGQQVSYEASAVVDHAARETMRELLAKLRRVQRGAYEQALARGERPPAPLAAAIVPFRPPVGAWRRARQHPGLSTRTARCAYLVSEWTVRVHGVLVRGQEARRAAARPRGVYA